MVYNCERCNKEFLQPNMLLSHLQNRVKPCKSISIDKDIPIDTLVAKVREIQKINKENSKKCPHCSKEFIDRKKKYKHIMRCKNKIISNNYNIDIHESNYINTNHPIDYFIDKHPFYTDDIYQMINDNLYKFRNYMQFIEYLIKIKWFNINHPEYHNIRTKNKKIDIPFDIFSDRKWIYKPKRETMNDIISHIIDLCFEMLKQINSNLTSKNIYIIINKCKSYSIHVNKCIYNIMICNICKIYHIHKNKDGECIFIYNSMKNELENHHTKIAECIICDNYNSHRCNKNICNSCINYHKYMNYYIQLNKIIYIRCILNLHRTSIELYKNNTLENLHSNINIIFYTYSIKDIKDINYDTELNYDHIDNIHTYNKEEFNNFYSIYIKNCKYFLDNN